jgi:hypothetical protein
MPTTLAQFKKYLEEKNIVESKNEVKRYLIDICEDSNNGKLCILSWWKHNILKYNIFSKVSQHVLAILVLTMAFKSTFSIDGCILNQYQSFFSPNLQQQFKHLFVIKIGCIID